MTGVYCSIIFQIITFWGDKPVAWHSKWDRYDHGVRLSQAQGRRSNFEYGFDVRTWGVSLKECEVIPAKDHLKLLGYLANFEGDGGVCNL